jgi:DNA-binding NarL/FixJ family response regulator
MKPSSNHATKTRLLLVDDHALFRRGLTALIESEPDLMVCAEATNHQAGLAAITATHPDLVIADLALKESDGLEMIKDIKRCFPGQLVLVLSMHEETTYAERALRAGARGYLTKQDMDETVLVAIRRILAGEIYTSEAISRLFAQRFIGGANLNQKSGTASLSDRELEVFKLVGCGKSSREIAESLSLSVKTIESHRDHIKVKLNLLSGAALNRCAILWKETGHIA